MVIKKLLIKTNESDSKNWNCFTGMISRHTDAFNALYNSQLNALIEVIDSWAEFAVYTAKLRALQPNFIEKLRIVFDVNPNHFNTLIHGDMYVVTCLFLQLTFLSI